MRRDPDATKSAMAVEPRPNEGERRLRADAQRNHDRILAAADAVLAVEGLSAPIDEVALRAGVGVGTVYRHFPTRETLYEAVVVARIERLIADALARATAVDAGDAFFGFLSSMVEQGAQNVALVDALSRAGYDVKAANAHVKARLVGALAELLARAQGAGAVRTDVTTEDVVGLMAASCIMTDREGGTAAARRRLEIIFDGLRPPS